MKKVIVLMMALVLLCGCSEIFEPYSTEETTVTTTGTTVPGKEVLPVLDDFTKYDYTVEQIEGMKTLLTNVGVTELTDLEMRPVVNGMQTGVGVAYSDYPHEVQIRITIENGVIFFVHLYCPSYGYEGRPTYLDGLTDRRATLYYDTEGGYLKRIDWENKAVVDY